MGITSPGCYKILMSTTFQNLTVLKDVDTVRSGNSGKSMSNNNCSPTFHQALNGFSDFQIRCDIKRGSWLVEQQYLGIF